jgi:hypothetical protein
LLAELVTAARLAIAAMAQTFLLFGEPVSNHDTLSTPAAGSTAARYFSLRNRGPTISWREADKLLTWYSQPHGLRLRAEAVDIAADIEINGVHAGTELGIGQPAGVTHVFYEPATPGRSRLKKLPSLGTKQQSRLLLLACD